MGFGLILRTCTINSARIADPQKVGILLFLPDYSSLDSRYGQTAYLFLDEALGEYDVEMKVGFIQLLSHESKEFTGSHPIKELGDAFDVVMKARTKPPNIGQPQGPPRADQLR